MTRKRLAVLAAAAAALVVIAAVAFVAWLALSVDRIVAAEIERAGGRTTGTSVDVGGLDIVLKRGAGTIDRFRVANPKGFTPASLLQAEGIDFDIDLTTLREDVLVVESVEIRKPGLRFEVSPEGVANVDVVAKHASSLPPDADAGPPRKIRIRRFVISGGSIDADASALGGKQEKVALRDVVLTNVGGKDGGTSDEIAAEVVGALRKEILRAVAQEGFKRYLSGKEDEVKGRLRDRVKGLFGK